MFKEKRLTHLKPSNIIKKGVTGSPGELAEEVLGGDTIRKTIGESEKLTGHNISKIQADTKSFITKTLKIPGTLLALPIEFATNLTGGIANIITNTWDKVGTVLTGVSAIPAAIATKVKSLGLGILGLPGKAIGEIKKLAEKIPGASKSDQPK